MVEAIVVIDLGQECLKVFCAYFIVKAIRRDIWFTFGNYFPLMV